MTQTAGNQKHSNRNNRDLWDLLYEHFYFENNKLLSDAMRRSVCVKGRRGEEDGERWDDGEDGKRTKTQPVNDHRRKAPVINHILFHVTSQIRLTSLPQTFSPCSPSW